MGMCPGQAATGPFLSPEVKHVLSGEDSASKEHLLTYPSL